MKAIITGGGTGGHIYPALSIARALLDKGWEILYIGSNNGLEGKIIPKQGLAYAEIDVAYLPRKISFQLLIAVLKTSMGLFQSRKLIKDYKPDLVVGTGGFVAGPVVLAATYQGVKTLIHEQNVYPGFTNRLLARRVDRIAINFQEAEKYFPDKVRDKLVLTGNPIRDIILTTKRTEGAEELGLKTDKKTLLVFGGSQGAASINTAMIELYKNLRAANAVQVIHITGEKNYNNYIKQLEQKGINLKRNDNYKIMPYLERMELAYALADLIIYRAGATGIAEITAKGIPAILIPYPFAAENHQEYNARNLEKEGAAIVIQDKNLDGQVLLEKVEGLFQDEKQLRKMSVNSKKLGQPEALVKLINNIEDLIS